jgi:hypothetical protein
MRIGVGFYTKTTVQVHNNNIKKERYSMKKIFSLLAVTMMLAGITASSAHAADCVTHVKRTACTGQETESYKKCDGKQECDKAVSEAASEADCTKAALSACDNARVDVTKSKVVTGTFKGAPLTGGFTADGKPDPKGPNFCAADRPDMNKCQ